VTFPPPLRGVTIPKSEVVFPLLLFPNVDAGVLVGVEGAGVAKTPPLKGFATFPPNIIPGDP